MASRLRIFFATDIHGSEVCFRKFVNAASAYRADVLLLGGDITGKELVPVVKQKDGWRATDVGVRRQMRSQDELEEFIKQTRAVGAYPLVVDEDESSALTHDESYRDACFRRVMRESLASWIELADQRLQPLGVPCFISLGNDDDPSLEEILRCASWVQYPEGSVKVLNGHEMVSWGWSNRTPWDSPREQDEDVLERAVGALAEQLHDPETAIFNLHCPPWGSSLDLAPAIDQNFRPITRGGQISLIPVGSKAVRRLIERFQPLLGLHGHVHDSRAMGRINRSICINPGSDYQQGILRGVLLDISKSKLEAWSFTSG